MRHVRVEIRGIVQGVGFRPFVYRIAGERGVRGSVSNTSTGVTIEALGDDGLIDSFLEALRSQAPPQAAIESFEVKDIHPFEADFFTILRSDRGGERSVLVSPDLATCPDCVRELFDPGDRRYRYPFINCTNCGPRFTIIRNTPYDRPATSMAKFEMCPECRREYEDPSDRRFHAQPNACPVCGPRLWLAGGDGRELPGDAIGGAAKLLAGGKIIALKGLGGFHLACDATNDSAVELLRERKLRYGKPLAVMVRSTDEAAACCEMGEEERGMMTSPRSSIVLLRERESSPLSRSLNQGLEHQGIFVPYTPLHHLLMSEVVFPLVMTSGNVSSEPIATGNDEAIARLGRIADFFLMHDRDILVRYDDSVTRVFLGEEYPVRRARGYAPYPLKVSPPFGVEVLALGAELKNTFCLGRGEQAFMSQHIGDMETEAELEHFETALDSMKRLFSLEPKLVAHDLHPDYMTTQMAPGFGLPTFGVQHHHAHAVSCMADNGASGTALGVCWDGTGYGEDGTVWGGEFLLCDETGYKRLAHLRQYPMPGADACIFKLYRMAMGVLFGVYGDSRMALERLAGLLDFEAREGESMTFQLDRGVNAPLTSSAGRMFDAVAALAGLRSEALYDGQAASELEAVAINTGEYYNFTLDRSSDPWVVDTRTLFTDIIEDVEAGKDAGLVAGKFHETMARIAVETAAELCAAHGVGRVALSGGVFQNVTLTARVVEGLEAAGLETLLHRRVPCNDGGISLGQAVIAAARGGV